MKALLLAALVTLSACTATQSNNSSNTLCAVNLDKDNLATGITCLGSKENLHY